MFEKNIHRLNAQRRVNKLNELSLLKENKILACNFAYMYDGTTYCDLYNKSNRKRIRVKTNILFENKDFLDNPITYLKSKEYFNNLLTL